MRSRRSMNSAGRRAISRTGILARPFKLTAGCIAQNTGALRAFEKAGFSVSINHPYSGGFITTHYGQECADKGKIAFQIEVNQDLYSNPDNKQLIPERLDDVKSRVWQSFEEITKRL